MIMKNIFQKDYSGLYEAAVLAIRRAEQREAARLATEAAAKVKELIKEHEQFMLLKYGKPL